MNSLAETGNSDTFQRNVMTSFIQIAAVVILISASINIIGPFAGLVLWGVIMAVAVYPVHLKLAAMLGGKAKLSVLIIILAGLALVVLPAWMMAESAITSIMAFAGEAKAGNIDIPPPGENVAGWPLIGERLYAVWAGAAANLEGTLNQFQPQLRNVGEWLARSAGSLAIGVLQFAISIIIAGVAMLYADNGYKLSKAIAQRINPDRGQHWTDISIATIRSVTNGVLGVAVIQAVLAAIGFFVMQVPHAGILTAIVLITSIVQVPALVIIVPIILWVFSFAAPVPATIFAVYSMFVALSDNVLKPILLGRGVDLPALIVLIGAIGGMIEYGIVGLFVGAVILGLAYTILSDWLRPAETRASEAEAGAGK